VRESQVAHNLSIFASLGPCAVEAISDRRALTVPHSLPEMATSPFAGEVPRFHSKEEVQQHAAGSLGVSPNSPYSPLMSGGLGVERRFWDSPNCSPLDEKTQPASDTM
jgi:hypothetical protein